ncbi:MAG: hypothetical protein EPO63_04305 [Candidatus Nitrosotenuis sp.]|nr:MAG: hypothetical protein EPO63_04305 [Candidatus Nitrosotenuis sp.]
MSVLLSDSNIAKKASILIPDVESICIINNKGRVTEAIGIDAIKLLNDKKEMFLMGFALLHSMQKDFDEDIEPVEYSLTKRGNAKFISIPMPNGTVILVVTKKHVDHERIVDGIICMINRAEEFLGVKLRA